jgi:VanZ family protein
MNNDGMETPLRIKYRYLIYYWIPILVYVFVLFIQSSFPSIATPKGSHLDKFLHVGAYSVLGFLFARAYGASRMRSNLVLVLILGIGSASIYGVLDEIHQYFVPFRKADLLDVGADILGSVIGACVYWWLQLKDRSAQAP